jgi:hypothetical protein
MNGWPSASSPMPSAALGGRLGRLLGRTYAVALLASLCRMLGTELPGTVRRRQQGAADRTGPSHSARFWTVPYLTAICCRCVSGVFRPCSVTAATDFDFDYLTCPDQTASSPRPVRHCGPRHPLH